MFLPCLETPKRLRADRDLSLISPILLPMMRLSGDTTASDKVTSSLENSVLSRSPPITSRPSLWENSSSSFGPVLRIRTSFSSRMRVRLKRKIHLPFLIKPASRTSQVSAISSISLTVFPIAFDPSGMPHYAT